MSMRALLEAVEPNKRLIDLLYTAEVENLLTHDNLKAYAKSGGRWRLLDDKEIYELIGLRSDTIPLRFGRLPSVDVGMLREYASQLEGLIKHAGVRVRSFEPVNTDDPSIDARISKLLDKVSEAQWNTKHAQKLDREEEARKWAGYRRDTGGDRW